MDDSDEFHDVYLGEDLLGGKGGEYHHPPPPVVNNNSSNSNIELSSSLMPPSCGSSNTTTCSPCSSSPPPPSSSPAVHISIHRRRSTESLLPSSLPSPAVEEEKKKTANSVCRCTDDDDRRDHVVVAAATEAQAQADSPGGEQQHNNDHVDVVVVDPPPPLKRLSRIHREQSQSWDDIRRRTITLNRHAADEGGHKSSESDDSADEISVQPPRFRKFSRVSNCAEDSISCFLCFLKDGQLQSRCHSPKLKSLIQRYGIPDFLRPALWMFLSGAHDKLMNNKDVYSNVLASCNEKVTDATVQIDKDIDRTFLSSRLFHSKSEMEKLRTVLCCFSWYSPQVGYCQAMNYVAAAFLLFLNEEQSFWLLSTIVEDLCISEYYREGMPGIFVDMCVLNTVVRGYLPDLMRHLDDTGVALELFASSWFLTMFIGTFPLNTALYVLDLIFSEGVCTLFRIVVAILKRLEHGLCSKTDQQQLFILLRDSPTEYSTSQLQQAMSSVRGLEPNAIEALQTYVKENYTYPDNSRIEAAPSETERHKQFKKPLPSTPSLAEKKSHSSSSVDPDPESSLAQTVKRPLRRNLRGQKKRRAVLMPFDFDVDELAADE